MSRSASAARLPPDRLWNNRNFILLWLAYAVSAFGDHLSEMGLLQMQDAMHRTDSTRIEAAMTFAFMLPYFLLGPAMGWLADRAPRKWVMIAADLVRGAFMLSLFGLLIWLESRLHGSAFQLPGLTHTDTHRPLLSVWFYGLPLLFTGCFAAMFSPSRAALLPTLVREDQIVRANALTNALGPLATIVSYVVGGILVERYGVRRNFQVDGLTFFASAACILFILAPRRRADATPPLSTSTSVKQHGISAGFRYVASHRRVAEIISFGVIFWVAASVVRCAIPGLVKGVFGGTISDVGKYQGTLGIGILAGALLLSVLGEALRPQIAISWSLAGAGLGTLWLALVSLHVGLGRTAGYAGLFTAGFFGAGVLVGVNALLQRIVPDRFRGRVFGVSDFASMAGLLLATGLLGMPDLPHIDTYIPAILAVVGFGLVVSGIIAVRVRLSRGRFAGSLNFWLSVNYLGCKLWARLRRIGPCTIPGTGPVIVACNHVSAADHFLLLASSPNRLLSFMVAREYYDMPLIGRPIKVIDCIPVNRTGTDTASVKAALRHLNDGKALGIFPQGRIMPPDDTTPARDGIGLLALRSGATVIPAYVKGIRPSTSVINPFLWPHHATIRYGKPVDLSAWHGRTGDRETYREASQAIMAAVRMLGRSS